MILQFCNIRLYGVVVYTLGILPAVVILFIFPPVSSQTLTHVHCGAAACTVALPTQSVTKITDFNGATRTRPCCYYYYFVIHMRKEQKKNTILLVASSPTARCYCRTHTHWTRFPWGMIAWKKKRRFFKSFTLVIWYTPCGAFWAPSANFWVEKIRKCLVYTREELQTYI